jgi:signal transduction histidine kinase
MATARSGPTIALMIALARWLRRHPWVGDALLVFVVVMSGLELRQGHVARVLPILLGLALPLMARRRFPVPVFAVVSLVAFVQWLADVPPRGSDVAVLVALYTVAAHERDRRIVVVASLVALGGAGLAVIRWHEGRFLPAVVAPVALTLVAVALGDDRRNRRAYFAGLEERAERLERERDALAEVAASTERARIARELHDVVAHSLSVMVAQADGAACTVESDPSRAGRAMEVVADTGRDALAEMRRLLGVLRPSSSPGELNPQPSLAGLETLVDNVRGTGLAVDLSVSGEPVELPAGLSLAAYRIVQESLTNTIKHRGPGAHATVRLCYAPTELTLNIGDDGRGIRSPVHDGSGRGLAGMHERAAMYAGSIHAGPSPEGGFEVVAAFTLDQSVDP